MNSDNTGTSGDSAIRKLLLVFCVLIAVLLALFWKGLIPGHIVFSNDGPLGTQAAASHRLPDVFTGGWEDLNTLGFSTGGAQANITYALLYLVGPVGFAKLYAPFSLLLLGLAAWTFLRQLKLSNPACIIGALAASLNSGFFSASTWGVASHSITVAMSFFALAAVLDLSSGKRWIRLALGGFALGIGVSEGADVGAFYSILVAAFVLYQSSINRGVRGLPLGFLRIAIVAAFALFIAAQSVITLVSTQIQGVSGMNQDTQTREQRWDWATQWSLPKREAPSIFIPGLYGYRMDTPDGGQYWGAIGQDPSWDRYFASGAKGNPPQGFLRFVGGGIYAGILVGVVAFWAILQGFRKKDSVFSSADRRRIWFWSAVLLVSLLLSFGRFAPFYQLLYMLPYFSTIRNPVKFVHVFNFALIILFAYGIHGLWQQYMAKATTLPRLGLKEWWNRVKGFDRGWTLGSILAVGVVALGWLVYASSRNELIAYLQKVRFDEESAQAIANFSVSQVGVFVVLFALAITLVILVLSGAFSGPRAKLGAILLGLFVVFDLGRANQPFVVVWDYQQKYASNPILDKLSEKPYLQRVAILPGWLHQAVRAPAQLQLLDQLYRIEWAQHHFLYQDIQSLDIIQMPRMPEDLASFEGALHPTSNAEIPHLLTRRWQLTNTRYLLGPADYVPVLLNPQIDPEKQRFQILQRFDIAPKPGIQQPQKLEELTAVPSTNGAFAIIEFTGALPRAKLYSDWEVNTNATAALQKLRSPAFDPQATVLISSPIRGNPQPAGTNTNPGSVEFVSYAPKHIVLKANALADAVLLLNDRYDANWKVTVDGKPAPLLKANYIMRGVFVPKGEHTITFDYKPPTTPLYVSVAAWVVALLLILSLVVVRQKERTVEQQSTK